MKIRAGMPSPSACIKKENSFHAKYRRGYTQLFFLAIILASVTNTFAQEDNDYTPSNLGPYEVQLRTYNPLREPFNFNYRPTPTAVDIDLDGDTDVVVADYDGGFGFNLLRNDGTPTAPAFNRATYLANPFGYISFDDGGTLTFTDIDTDGDLDMLFGTIDGTFRFYKRTNPTGLAWTHQTSTWNPATKSGNPMYGVDLGDFTSPVFNDMDSDGDLDLLIGSSYAPNNKSMHYYVNDGQFNFTASTLSGINPDLAEATPTFIDADNDGDQDVVVGAADGNLYYFKRIGATTFEQQTGADNPFAFFNHGQFSSPTAADFDNDGDKDLVVGVVDALIDFAYIENKGNGVFEEKTSFENPFGGAAVISDAAPYFLDVDGDNDKDFLMGSSDNADPYLKYFRNENGKYMEVTANNPFSGSTVGNMFIPSFADMDGDGDLDLVGSADNGDMTYIEYFKNENGNYVKQNIVGSPFENIYWQEGRGDFSDIDKDGDFDLIATDRRWEMGDYHYFIRYFENTGSATSAAFTERTGTQNPLHVVFEDFELVPRFFDIDHDGDLDAIIGESGGVVENTDGNEVHLYENISTTNTPVFKYRGNLTQQGRNPYEPSPSFIDQDADGDLDIFYGTAGGELVYYKNVNPAATLTINSTPLSTAGGSTAIIDPLLTLADADSDSIVFAQVSISGFVPGQTSLSYTAVAGIDGNYNASTGVLTFTGKAPLASYQTLLRSVAIAQSAPSNGRLKNPSLSFATISRTVVFEVADADRTLSTPVSRVVNFVSASAPVFADLATSVIAGGTVTVDLKTLVTDSNNDVDFSTLTITQAPSSGNAAINAAGILTVGFAPGNFAGEVTVGVNVCDAGGLCDAGTITINVTNTAPVFANASVNVNAGASVVLDLKTLITDTENNLDLSTISIVQNPGSGAVATIDANKNLTVAYQNIAFAGSETVRVNGCDLIGACTTSTITVNVQNTSPIFNSASVTIPYHGAVNVNLATLISDAESNINANSLVIVTGSQIGGAASLSGMNFSVNYAAVNSAGTDILQLRICDITGSCADASITVTIQNAPPVIQPEPVSTAQGTSKTLNLLDVTSDADGNLDVSTFVITQAPSSGANARIDVISPGEVRLTIDYSGITFFGNDQLTIRACDAAGACTENVISIEVSSEVEIYNAIAPNSAGDNKFFRILNLPAENKVSIFNRWGDVVYHAEGYDNDAVKFEGLSDGGTALASATYFYKIEYFDQSGSLKTLTGYLSLKQ